MYAVTVDIDISGDNDLFVDLDRIGQKIKSVAGPEHRLEHLYIRRSADGVNIVLFVIAPDLETAEGAVREIFVRAGLEAVPGYRIADRGVLLIIPIAEASLRATGEVS
jgi:hypothetical protein